MGQAGKDLCCHAKALDNPAQGKFVCLSRALTLSDLGDTEGKTEKGTTRSSASFNVVTTECLPSNTHLRDE